MASTNNALNNQSTTNIASTTQTFTVSNSDNTGTSAAQVRVSVGGGTTSGDPQTSFIVNGVNTWSVGVDNSASDVFSIANNSNLGTNAFQLITTSGAVRWNGQPAFLAYLNSADTNVTGTGTVFQVGSVTAMTEVFDRTGEFNTNGTFTSSVDGQYFFAANIQLEGCTINSGIEIQIITLNRTYSTRFNRAAAATNIGISLATLADMDNGDTAQFAVVGYGEAGDTDDVSASAGGSPLVNFFCGYLMG